MKTYAVFIRAVTPTGKNKVPNSELRKLLEKAGYKNVQTYIASGNAIVDTNLSKTQIEKSVHEIILKNFGGDLPIVAIEKTKLKQVLSKNPFEKRKVGRVYLTFLKKKPAAAKILGLNKIKNPPERIVITPEVVYLWCPDKYMDVLFTNGFIEKKLSVAGTTRVIKTAQKVLDLASLKKSKG